MSEIPSPDQNQKDETRKKPSKVGVAAAGIGLTVLGAGAVGVPAQLVRDGMLGTVATPNPFGHSTAPRIEADNPLTLIATPIDEVFLHYDSHGPNHHLDLGNNPTIETTTSLPNQPNGQLTPPKGDLVIPEKPIN